MISTQFFQEMSLSDISTLELQIINGGEVDPDCTAYRIGYVIYSALCDFGQLFKKGK